MATVPMHAVNGATRRVVLIDFGWQDADLMPELLSQPGISVRLVAGAHPEDPGLRVAELCGLPRTLDLADLTREIFDVALVGEASSRRTQIEGLLLALGTTCSTPQEYLGGGSAAPDHGPAIEAPLALHAAAFEHAMGGGDFAALVEHALPDLAEDSALPPRPAREREPREPAVPSLADFPSPADRQGLESALRHMVENTGAVGAELHAGSLDRVERVAQVGPEDPLLRGLIDLALQLGTPQVVTRLSEPQKGKAWGAWPFRTTQRRGVLAAAAIEPGEGFAAWQNMVGELRDRWDERDRAQAGPAFPMLPDGGAGWLDPEAFHDHLELAVDRNRRDGLRFELHRLEFAEAPEAMEAMAEWLPQTLRDTDRLCRPAPRVVLLLTAGPAQGYTHLRRRVLVMWETVWRSAARPLPVPEPGEQSAVLGAPEDAPELLATATAWLTS